jgi:hypothetical protein
MAMSLAVPGQEQNGGASMSAEDGTTERIPRITSAGTIRGEVLYRELGATGENAAELLMPEENSSSAFRLSLLCNAIAYYLLSRAAFT